MRGVHLGLVVLEVQHVGERQAGADGRDPVALDEHHERVGVALEDPEAVVGAAVVEVHDQRPDRVAVGVDRHRRRVLAVDADVGDVGGGRGRRGDDLAHRADDRGPELGRDPGSATSPSRTVVIGRAAAAISRPVSSTSATLAFVVPTSIPRAWSRRGG